QYASGREGELHLRGAAAVAGGGEGGDRVGEIVGRADDRPDIDAALVDQLHRLRIFVEEAMCANKRDFLADDQIERNGDVASDADLDQRALRPRGGNGAAQCGSCGRAFEGDVERALVGGIGV